MNALLAICRVCRVAVGTPDALSTRPTDSPIVYTCEWVKDAC